MHKSIVEAWNQEKANLRDTLQACKQPRSIQHDPRGQGSATFNIKIAILSPFPPDTILELLGCAINLFSIMSLTSKDYENKIYWYMKDIYIKLDLIYMLYN